LKRQEGLSFKFYRLRVTDGYNSRYAGYFDGCSDEKYPNDVAYRWYCMGACGSALEEASLPTDVHPLFGFIKTNRFSRMLPEEIDPAGGKSAELLHLERINP